MIYKFNWHNMISLTEIIPDVHLSAQSADLDNSLTEEVVWLTLEFLFHTRLNVIILIPHSHLDAVWGVVTLTAQTEPQNQPRFTLIVGQQHQMDYYADSLNMKH